MYKKKAIKASSTSSSEKKKSKNLKNKQKPNPKVKRKTKGFKNSKSKSVSTATLQFNETTNSNNPNIKNDENKKIDNKDKRKKKPNTIRNKSPVISEILRKTKTKAKSGSSQIKLTSYKKKHDDSNKANLSKKIFTKEAHKITKIPETKPMATKQANRNKLQSKKDKSINSENINKTKINSEGKNRVINTKTIFKRRRGHRVASLNALAKVKLLCENDKLVKNVKSEERSVSDKKTSGTNNEELFTKSSKNKTYNNRKQKSDPGPSKKDTSKKSLCNKKVTRTKKKITRRKKIMIDPDVEIIDTRKCKRMASLNASAMMAATYLPEKERRVVCATNPGSQQYLKPNSGSISGQVVHHHHQWSSRVEEHIEMTTVKTLVKLRHDNTIVETISTQYEQQKNILAEPTDDIDNLSNPKKRRTINKKLDKLAKSVCNNNSTSSSTASSSSAFTPCSSGSLVSGNHSLVPNTFEESFKNSRLSQNDKKRKNKAISTKRSRQQTVTKNSNNNDNNSQTNSIFQKYIIETRMESSINDNKANPLQNSRLPNGISFNSNDSMGSSAMKNFDNTVSNSISSSSSSSSNTGNNLFSYNLLNSTPFQIIPFSAMQPNHSMIQSNFSPFISTTNNHNSVSTSVNNSNNDNTHNYLNAPIYQYQATNFVNHQFSTPIPVPFLQLPNAMQPNSYLGISYLNTNNPSNIYHSTPSSNHQFINVFNSNTESSENGTRLVHRPVPFHPQQQPSQSGQTTFNNTNLITQSHISTASTTPQIINVNGSNHQLPNLINYSLLRQPSVASIRPINFPINSFPSQQTFFVQTPIINHHNTFSFGSVIPSTNNFYSQPNAFLKNNNSFTNISSTINNEINDNHLRQLTNMTNKIIINQNENGSMMDQKNNTTTVIEHNHRPRTNKNTLKKSKKINNDLNNHIGNNNKFKRSETNVNKLIQNGFIENNLIVNNINNNERKKLKNEKSFMNLCVEQQNGSKHIPKANNKRSNLLLSSNNKLINSQDNIDYELSQLPNATTNVMTSPILTTDSILPTTFNGGKKHRRPIVHGWSWEGEPFQKNIFINNDEQSILRKCYPAIKHNEGEIIRIRDCVLLKSGPRKTDLPFVAKITSLWESPENEMMMSLLWYYRPEHTEIQENFISGEIYASRHRDTNSVACIDDKCFVLTYNEYCRYKRQKIRQLQPFAYLQPDKTALIVPDDSLNNNDTDEDVTIFSSRHINTNRIPPLNTLPELVFCCRKVYDFRQKRILKNPS